MSTATIASTTQSEPELLGQTVVVIGGSSGIGFETARRARAEGAKVILAARNPERLKHAASEVDAHRSSMPRTQLLSKVFFGTCLWSITSW
jgi:NAD(P)-dependent dehydrogenase (short-subunit alcohol dehydrogenase family)